MARIVVVSNRVAVPSGDGGARAGGLEVALRSFLKRHHGVWFGWSGRVVAKGEEDVRSVEHGGVTYVTTDLTRTDFQDSDKVPRGVGRGRFRGTGLSVRSEACGAGSSGSGSH